MRFTLDSLGTEAATLKVVGTKIGCQVSMDPPRRMPKAQRRDLTAIEVLTRPGGKGVLVRVVCQALETRSVLFIALTGPSGVTVSEAHILSRMFSRQIWRALSRSVAFP